MSEIQKRGYDLRIISILISSEPQSFTKESCLHEMYGISCGRGSSMHFEFNEVLMQLARWRAFIAVFVLLCYSITLSSLRTDANRSLSHHFCIRHARRNLHVICAAFVSTSPLEPIYPSIFSSGKLLMTGYVTPVVHSLETRV